MPTDPASPVIEFYRLRGRDAQGRLLADLWTWNHDQLESCHDFIQCMFPLAEPSSVNPHAPLLSTADRAAFAGEPNLQSAMRNSLAVFLDFLGLQVANGRVEKAAHFPRRIAIWKYSNHNWLRITRMLRSLRLVGLEAEARQVWDCLRRLHEQEGYVSQHSFDYWRDAAVGRI